ncbi:MAG: hypothetical protein V1784_00740 [bacterium]
MIAANGNRMYVIVCLVLLPVAVLFSFARPWTATADHWETAAAIRAISENILRPTNPIFDLPGDTSPRFTPYTVFWGVVMKFTGLGLFVVFGIAGVVNYLLFVTGLARLVRKQFQDQSLPLFALFSMLIVCGTGYHEPDSYQFADFFIMLPLVARFAYGICFHALAALRAYLDERRPRDLGLYVMLSAISFVTHPITAAFGFVAAAAMLLAETDLRRTILFQVVPLLALVAAIAWPYFDYFAVLIRGSVVPWFENPIKISRIFDALGPAIVGVPIILYYGLKKRLLFLAYGFVFCLLIYILCGMARISIGSRFIWFAAFFMHLAIAQYMLEHNLLRWGNLRASLQSQGLAFVLICALLMPALFYRAREVKWTMGLWYDPPFHLFACESPSQPFFFLVDRLGPSDVVMATDTTGWTIPAITGARVIAQLKGNPLISMEVGKRRSDAAAFFGAVLSTEERQKLLREYHATHILFDLRRAEERDPSLLRDLPVLAQKEAECGVIVLYKVPT